MHAVVPRGWIRVAAAARPDRTATATESGCMAAAVGLGHGVAAGWVTPCRGLCWWGQGWAGRGRRPPLRRFVHGGRWHTSAQRCAMLAAFDGWVRVDIPCCMRAGHIRMRQQRLCRQQGGVCRRRLPVQGRQLRRWLQVDRMLRSGLLSDAIGRFASPEGHPSSLTMTIGSLCRALAV